MTYITGSASIAKAIMLTVHPRFSSPPTAQRKNGGTVDFT